MIKGLEFHKKADELYDSIHKKSFLEEDIIDVQEYLSALLPNTPLFRKFVIMETKKYKRLKRQKRLDVFFPLHREIFLRNEKYMFNGIVDRIDKLTDGNYAVVDYKTGKFSEYGVEGYEFELLGYKMLVDSNNILDKPVLRGCIVFPKEMRRKWFDFTVPTPKAWFKKVIDTREKISRKEFDKKEGILCNWCPYMEECIK